MTRATKFATNLISSLNPWSLVSFTKRIKNIVGLKFTLMLSSNYYITKGFAHSFIRSIFGPWFRFYGIEAQFESIGSTIAMMPWSMKGFFGVISDNFALFGYSKTSYLMIYSVGGTIAAALLAIIPDNALFIAYQFPSFLVFIIHCQGSAGDLYCEGKYVEKMKEFPEIKGDLVTYVWFCQMVGGFPASLLVGPFVDNFDPKWLFIAEVPLVAQMIPFLIAGCMVDDKVSPEMKNKWNSKKFVQQWKIMTLGVLMGTAAMTLALMSFTPIAVQAISAIVVSIVMVILVFSWMNKIIAGAIVYLFCTTVFNITDGSVTFYWITETNQDCVPNGPQFSFTFLYTYAGIVGSFFQMFGLWGFQFFLIKRQLRTMFWVTNAIQITIGLIDIMFYTRTNVALGINDYVFYMFSGAVFGPFFYMMNFMPSNILIAKMCPKDVEVTVYAILAGFSNFGNSVASYVGTYFSRILNIQTIPPCDYSNLILQIVVISMFPIVEIPLTFLLIPKGTLDTDFLKEGRQQLEKELKGTA